MLSGNDIAPAFDIIGRAKAKFAMKTALNIGDAQRIVAESYREKRAEEAESRYLRPLGWTLAMFNSPSSGAMPNATRTNITYMLQTYSLTVSLLIAGLDASGKGHIFSVDDEDNRGSPRRHDIPGYHAIGSGGFGAEYMMAYRDLSPAMPIREALYYVTEGKYFGELASGVGTKTDLYILRFGRSATRILPKAIEDKLIKLCQKLEPKELGEKGVEILNSLHGKHMDTIPKLQRKKEGKEWAITAKSDDLGRRPRVVGVARKRGGVASSSKSSTGRGDAAR